MYGFFKVINNLLYLSSEIVVLGLMEDSLNGNKSTINGMFLLKRILKGYF